MYIQNPCATFAFRSWLIRQDQLLITGVWGGKHQQQKDAIQHWGRCFTEFGFYSKSFYLESLFHFMKYLLAGCAEDLYLMVASFSHSRNEALIFLNLLICFEYRFLPILVDHY